MATSFRIEASQLGPAVGDSIESSCMSRSSLQAATSCSQSRWGSASLAPGQPGEVTRHMELLGFIGQVGEEASACEHRRAILRRSRDLDELVCGDGWRTLFDRKLHVFLLAVSSCIRCCDGALSRDSRFQTRTTGGRLRLRYRVIRRPGASERRIFHGEDPCR
jgi:hypothetical protein